MKKNSSAGGSSRSLVKHTQKHCKTCRSLTKKENASKSTSLLAALLALVLVFGFMPTISFAAPLDAGSGASTSQDNSATANASDNDSTTSESIASENVDGTDLETLPDASDVDKSGNNLGDTPEASEGAADDPQGDSSATDSDETLADEGADATDESEVVTMEAVSVEPGLYTIASVLDINKVIDIPSASMDSGVKISLWTSNMTPAQRFSFVKNSDGTYTIKNIKSEKVLDVAGAGAFDGATVWQYTPNNTVAQKWIIETAGSGSSDYKLVSCVDSNYVLEVASGDAKNGAQLHLMKKSDSKAQQFTLNKITPTIANGTYIIKSVCANKALDVSAASTSDCGNIQVYQSNNTYAQRFSVSYEEATGYYVITNINSTKAVDVANGGMTNYSNVWQYASNGTYAQKWDIADTGSGQYGLIAAHSGLALDVSGAGTANGTNVQTYQWNATSAQKWVFESAVLVNEGIVTLKSGLGTVLDVNANSTANGANIQTYTSNDTMAQKFYLKHVGDGFYTLECLNSGSVATQISNGTNVVLWSNTLSNNQLWKPVVAGGGYFYLQNKQSGLCLDVVSANPAAGANVQVFTGNGTVAQRWTFVATEPISEGAFVITTAQNQNLAIEVANASGADSATLQLGARSGSIIQSFKFASLGGGNFKIASMYSGKVFDVNANYLNPNDGSGTLQLYTDNGTAAQKWRLQYVVGKGCFNIFSVTGNGLSCIDVSGGIFQSGQALRVYGSANTAAQEFRLSPEPDYISAPLNISINDMVLYQRQGNSYINHVSDQYLIDAIDPKISMQDYFYPGHYTYTGGVYQFADLRGYTGLTAAQLDSLINRSYGSSYGNLRGQGAAFVKAAKEYNLNECYLLAHAALESGWGTSTLALGKVAGYEGYYNFYGIGAYDADPLNGGAALAKINGWDTQEKAIMGAAKWISENYVYRSYYAQPTLYTMKWDYNRSNDIRGYGWHQYATDHLWARKIAHIMAGSYTYLGVAPRLNYIVPQYK